MSSLRMLETHTLPRSTETSSSSGWHTVSYACGKTLGSGVGTNGWLSNDPVTLPKHAWQHRRWPCNQPSVYLLYDSAVQLKKASTVDIDDGLEHREQNCTADKVTPQPQLGTGGDSGVSDFRARFAVASR